MSHGGQVPSTPTVSHGGEVVQPSVSHGGEVVGVRPVWATCQLMVLPYRTYLAGKACWMVLPASERCRLAEGAACIVA